jgi:predicted transposase YdaD
VLEDYLERQREEVIDMMLTLFDQETLMRNHDASVERRGWEAGKAEGKAEGKEEGKAEAVMNLMETMSLDLEKAMEALKIKDEEMSAIRKYVEDKIQGLPA